MTKDEECLKRVKGMLELELPNCIWMIITATPSGESALITSHRLGTEAIVAVLESAAEQLKANKVKVGNLI